CRFTRMVLGSVMFSSIPRTTTGRARRYRYRYRSLRPRPFRVGIVVILRVVVRMLAVELRQFSRRARREPRGRRLFAHEAAPAGGAKALVAHDDVAAHHSTPSQFADSHAPRTSTGSGWTSAIRVSRSLVRWSAGSRVPARKQSPHRSSG